MKTIAIALALIASSLIGGTTAGASASDATAKLTTANAANQSFDTSARRKVRHHRHVYRGYRYSYGYDRPYGAGYYRGIRPGWGYGPDPGDYAWPPFHFKPYW